MTLIVGLSGPPVAAGETWNGESRAPKAASTPTARTPRTPGGEHLTEVTAPHAAGLCSSGTASGLCHATGCDVAGMCSSPLMRSCSFALCRAVVSYPQACS